MPGESPARPDRRSRLGSARCRHEEGPGSGEVGVAGSAEVREELSELLARPEHAVLGHVPGRVQRRDLRPPRLLTGRPRTGAR